MKKLTLLLSLLLVIVCTSCKTSNFALSGGISVNTSKTKNGNTRSNEIEFNGSPDVLEVNGRRGSSEVNEDGQKVKEKEIRGGLRKEKKQTESSGN